MTDNTLGAYNIADLREMARRRLPKGMFEFVDRGTEDEIALANNRAAAAAGIPFTVAINSMTSMETIAGEAGGRLWFQLYMWSERALSHQIVARAKAAGFEALIVTVDGAVGANREYGHRNGFEMPFRFNRRNVAGVLARPGWLFSVLLRYAAGGRTHQRVCHVR